MNKLPCELVEDLLPMYVDQLTGSVTNDMIEEHLESCESCTQKYERMKQPVTGESEREVKEIDFLKKTKQRNKKRLLIWVAVVWLLAIVFLGARYYLCGSDLNPEYLFYQLDVSGTDLTIEVAATSEQEIRQIDISEEQGIVEICVKGVPKSIFFDRSESKDFAASQEIRQVRIGDRIIWADEEMISPMTSDLYAVYNPYVGSMPANGAVVSALNMTAYTGNFKNELQTKEQPYSWKLILENDFPGTRKEAFEQRLQMYSYLLLAQIGNLDEVIFEYTIDGETMSLSVTSEDATAFAGVDIKTVGQDLYLLEELVRKTGFSNYVSGDAVGSNAQVDASLADATENVLGFTVVNDAEDEIYGIRLIVESEQTEASQSMIAADNCALQRGLNVDFQLLPEDFEQHLEGGQTGKIRLQVTDQDGNVTDVQGEMSADLIWGSNYQVYLSGNARAGYTIRY